MLTVCLCVCICMWVCGSGQCRRTCNAVGLAGLVSAGHKPFVTQRQLHSRLNEAYPRVWLEVCVCVSVCVRVCVGVPSTFTVFFSANVKC